MGMDEAQLDYKYQTKLISTVPVAALVIVGLIAILLSGIWLSTFNHALETWAEADNLFILAAALFLTCWLIGWSIGTFLALVAFFMMLSGRLVVLVHSGRMEAMIGVIGFGLKIKLRATEVLSSRLTDANSKTGRQIQIETQGGEKGNSPFGRNMTEQDLAEFQSAIDRNKNIDSGLGDMPTDFDNHSKLSSKPKILSNSSLESQTKTTVSKISEPLTLTSSSTLLLIVANLVPLVGVVLFNWDLGSTMVLYWAETAIILFYTVCKGFALHKWLGLLGAVFMLAHAGAFMSMHFLFIWVIFIEGFANDTSFSGAVSSGSLKQVMNYLIALWPALLALLVSHGFSFKTNFLDKLDSLKTNTKKAKQDSANNFYSRIITMHCTIIFGGGAALILGSSAFALIMLIVLKIIADVRAHLKQHATS